MEFIRKHWLYIIVIILIVLNGFVWFGAWKEQPSAAMIVAFLDVGQGDAIFIESPTGNQLIIDGGPTQAILGELRKVMPFYDRHIDALIVTNPDKDHLAGFINVLRGYEVETVIEPGTKTDTKIYEEFSREVDEERAIEHTARRGMIIDLGGGAKLTVLYPDTDVSNETTNDGSIIARLTYGSTSVMLTGDAPTKTEEYVASLDGMNVQSDILKAGHHGSRTSASERFISTVNPKWAVISAGYKNRYKHPHPETLSLFEKYNIDVLGTYEKGTIIFTCTVSKCAYETER